MEDDPGAPASERYAVALDAMPIRGWRRFSRLVRWLLLELTLGGILDSPKQEMTLRVIDLSTGLPLREYDYVDRYEAAVHKAVLEEEVGRLTAAAFAAAYPPHLEQREVDRQTYVLRTDPDPEVQAEVVQRLMVDLEGLVVSFRVMWWEPVGGWSPAEERAASYLAMQSKAKAHRRGDVDSGPVERSDRLGWEAFLMIAPYAYHAEAYGHVDECVIDLARGGERVRVHIDESIWLELADRFPLVPLREHRRLWQERKGRQR